MNDTMNFSSSLDNMSSGMNNLLEHVANTCGQLADMFDRSIEQIAEFGVGVARKVKKFGLKFLDSFGYIDKELYNIFMIKHHLRDIHHAVENEMHTFEDNLHELGGSLIQIWDMLVQRMHQANHFYNHLGFAVEEIRPTIDAILHKAPVCHK